MEKLAFLAAISSMPAIFFILAAKVTGNDKGRIFMFLVLKLPSLLALVALILMAFLHFEIINLA
jgi:hypothetical protein